MIIRKSERNGRWSHMIPRDMESKLLQLAERFPVVSVTGPRQSGKSTLIRHVFPSYEYLSFEDPETRELFEFDPKRFLREHRAPTIFDEAQRVPELFSYLQGEVDRSNEVGRFILSGSQNFLLSKGISQSLAGRVGILRLLPLSCGELAESGSAPKDAWEWAYRGGYPRVFSAGIDPADFYPAYIETYLERDVRGELGVVRLGDFSRFLSVCALRCGELLNVAELARDCGIAPATAKNWLSVLVSSYVVFQLQPYSRNMTKRLVKTPKLYFYDTGLACSLLGIESADELEDHPSRGGLFEAAVISELAKRSYNRGRSPHMTFWRDSNKNEIDVVLEKGPVPSRAIEIKSSSTFRPRYFDTLSRIAPAELGLAPERCAVVYGGDESLESAKGSLVSFRDAGGLAT